MKNVVLSLVFMSITVSCSFSQTTGTLPIEKARKDSVAHAKMIADSLKMEKLFAVAQYPYLRGSKWSGVIPVDDPTEVPDPAHDYKLLFELSEKNPDSLSKEINQGLDEVARILNLHVASGIPAKKIFPVIVVHGPALQCVVNNDRYRQKHSVDNPNIKLVRDLQNIGAKIIACGQAMAFHELKREQLLPDVKVSLTAQTVLSNYQLQGYVLYSIHEDK